MPVLPVEPVATPRPQHIRLVVDHRRGQGSADRQQPGAGDRRERVRALLEKVAECTDPQELKALRDQVVLECRGVASAVAARYRGRGVDRNDLEQLANLGLVKAVRRWQPGRSEDFLQFAVPTIAGEIKRYFRDHSAAVRPPRRIQELRAALTSSEDERPVGSADDDGHAADGRSDDARRAEELGVSEAAIREAREAVRLCRPISLDAQSGWGCPIADTWGSEDERITQIEDRMTVQVLMRSLSPREREIVRMRFVEGMSQARIGECIGVSQMQVSRLLRSITSKLYQELAS
ncbi:RNA polymerase sigma factor [Nakamurella endophytica]|uniref:RNA polymerase sigma factor n=1 Tax=Nakamurella endophytica TaxID=1748367 RepID=A0A917TAR1_9ACTN|nr:RNA polymerase sigma factor [Nakamurella endophytica]